MNIKNRVLKNASWIIVCSIIQSIVTLIIGMISARYLGPSNYGLINYAKSIVTFIVPIVQLGLRNTIVQEIISNPDNEGEVLGTILISCIASSILGILGITAFVSIANYGETNTIIVCVLYSVSLLFQMTAMLQYWFQAKLLSKYVSLTSLFAYVSVSLYKIFLLVTGKNIYWFAIANAFDYLIISIVLTILYKKLSNQKLSFSYGLLKKLFLKSKYYIISGVMVTIFSETDKVMLKFMIGEAEVGFYSAALTCAGVTGFLFTAIIDSFRPMIFENKKVNQLKFEENITMLYSIIFFLGLIQSFFFCVGAEIIVNVLYGAEYAPAILMLRIIIWYSSFVYIGSVRNIWMLAEQQQNLIWKINLFAAVLNVIGNAILIPSLGAIGASITTVFTQFFANFILCFYFKQLKPCASLMVQALNPKNILSKLQNLREWRLEK